jgi:YgiT-type zinc finger domain-containing protein
MGKCQVCGSKNAKCVIGTENYEYKNKIIPILNFEKVVCDDCGQEVATDDSVKASVLILKEIKKMIDAGDYQGINLECEI